MNLYGLEIGKTNILSGETPSFNIYNCYYKDSCFFDVFKDPEGVYRVVVNETNRELKSEVTFRCSSFGAGKKLFSGKLVDRVCLSELKSFGEMNNISDVVLYLTK